MLDLLKLGDSRVYPRSCICSNHFKEGDISHGKMPSLKKNATPLLSRPAHWNKIRSTTFIVLERVKKSFKKVEKLIFCLRQISKCDSRFYTHFSRAIQNYSFQICSFSHKKVMGDLRFFYIYSGFLSPWTLP